MTLRRLRSGTGDTETVDYGQHDARRTESQLLLQPVDFGFEFGDSIVEFPYWRWGADSFTLGAFRPISTHVGRSISGRHGYASVTGYAASVTTGYAP